MLKNGFAALLLLIVLGLLAAGSFAVAYNSANNKTNEDVVKESPETDGDHAPTYTVTPTSNKQNGSTINQPTQIINDNKNTIRTPVYPSVTATVTTTVSSTPTPTTSSSISPTPTEKKGGKPTSSAPSTGG